MTDSSNSFANARVGFGGNARGIDEWSHELIKIDRAEGPRLFGEYRLLFAENKNNFDIGISSFGYVHHRDVGTLDRRVAFSATECETIERLIRSFFANHDVFKERLIPPELYLGGLVFAPSWILLSLAKP